MTVSAYAALERKGRLQPFPVELPELAPHEVELEVSHCGLCHGDLHLIDDSWNRSVYPLVPGHEIVGTVVARGAAVTELGLGERVGVGWQRGACLRCELCVGGQENLCERQQATCIGHVGGMAERVRVDARFAFPLPEALESPAAAPLMCGGVTVYAPLRRHGADATKSVAVIGIGGLGHIALQMLRAFGCEVTAFSSSAGKRDEALRLGAHDFAASTEPREVLEHAGRFDLVLSTVHARLDWTSFLRTLRRNGALVLVGTPPGLLQIPPGLLVTGQRSVTGSDIGGRPAIREMLQFAARHRIAPLVEPMRRDQVNAAIERLRANQVRYRVVLQGA